MAQGPRYWHFLPLTMIHTLLPEFQKMKWSHLSPWATNKRNKDAFFSSTFKVWESKVSLFLSFIAQGPRYWQFLPLTMVRTSLPELQKIKWPYLVSWAKNKKSKATFFSSTLKVWESKVCLFLSFIAQGTRYWHFLPLTMVRTPLPELRKIKWPYLVSWAKNQKSKAAFLPSTFKVWEGKVPLVLWFVAHELRYCHFLIYHLYPIAESL